MPIPTIQQEELIVIDGCLRLRAYDGKFERALDWYQDSDMVYMIDGSREPYSPERVRRMYDYLSARGEVYFIEVWDQECWLAIGDVTFWQDDLPIVIGKADYRGKGIGKKVLSALIQRARDLGYQSLAVQEIYDFNQVSRSLFESLGFYPTLAREKGRSYTLDLTLPIAQIQPSQFYLSREKLDRICIDFAKGELKPLPVKRMDGKVFFTDGHSRAFKAYQAGLSHIPVYYDRDELNWDFYRYCLQTCQEKGIFSISDIQNRILSKEDYQTKWLDWCKREARKFDKS
ncbi:GNAT family acetyltransferase [Streptococcus sanguinis SK72]|uniref:GNAT family acetyltransferase n=1 Tax=Streptococcus sanguinis SK72 TaxID=888809 RepID=F0I1G4_STRSA|nr:GNAT family N-acetyltransferase [Streptococcus sanguinis]EGD29692.1 GNAT family acetyltransferase [Streptococcus sanguinis SK72]